MIAFVVCPTSICLDVMVWHFYVRTLLANKNYLFMLNQCALIDRWWCFSQFHFECCVTPLRYAGKLIEKKNSKLLAIFHECEKIYCSKKIKSEQNKLPNFIIISILRIIKIDQRKNSIAHISEIVYCCGNFCGCNNLTFQLSERVQKYAL